MEGSSSITLNFGSIENVIDWLEERARMADKIAEVSTARYRSERAKGEADGYRNSALILREANIGGVTRKAG